MALRPLAARLGSTLLGLALCCAAIYGSCQADPHQKRDPEAAEEQQVLSGTKPKLPLAVGSDSEQRGAVSGVTSGITTLDTSQRHDGLTAVEMMQLKRETEEESQERQMRARLAELRMLPSARPCFVPGVGWVSPRANSGFGNRQNPASPNGNANGTVNRASGIRRSAIQKRAESQPSLGACDTNAIQAALASASSSSGDTQSGASSSSGGSYATTGIVSSSRVESLSFSGLGAYGMGSTPGARSAAYMNLTNMNDPSSAMNSPADQRTTTNGALNVGNIMPLSQARMSSDLSSNPNNKSVTANPSLAMRDRAELPASAKEIRDYNHLIANCRKIDVEGSQGSEAIKTERNLSASSLEEFVRGCEAIRGKTRREVIVKMRKGLLK